MDAKSYTDTKRLPLPAVFVVAAIFAAAFMYTLAEVRTGTWPAGLWDNPISWIVLAIASIGVAAWATAAEREGTFSFVSVLATWRWTVCSLMKRRSAISRFVRVRTSR